MENEENKGTDENVAAPEATPEVDAPAENADTETPAEETPAAE